MTCKKQKYILCFLYARVYKKGKKWYNGTTMLIKNFSVRRSDQRAFNMVLRKNEEQKIMKKRKLYSKSGHNEQRMI